MNKRKRQLRSGIEQRSEFMDDDLDGPLCKHQQQRANFESEAPSSDFPNVSRRRNKSQEFVECDGDYPDYTSESLPKRVNVTCRAVAHPNEEGSGYQYQIFDLETRSDTTDDDDDEEPPSVGHQRHSEVQKPTSSRHRSPNRTSRDRSNSRQKIGNSVSSAKDRSNASSRKKSTKASGHVRSGRHSSKRRAKCDDYAGENFQDYEREGFPVKSSSRRRHSKSSNLGRNDEGYERNKNENNFSDGEFDPVIGDHVERPPQPDVVDQRPFDQQAEATQERFRNNVSKVKCATTFPSHGGHEKTLLKFHSPAEDNKAEESESAFSNININSTGAQNEPNVDNPATANLTADQSFAGHRFKLVEFINNLFRQGQLTDVTINIGESCFQAHSAVLACYSKYFASRFLKESCWPAKKVMAIDHSISQKTFKTILEYMYTGDCHIGRRNFAKVFVAAEFLGVTGLIARCKQMLSEGFKEDEEARKPAEIEKQWKQVARNFKAIVRTDQFLNLSPECVMKLLVRDDLAVKGELDVADAAIRWLNFDRKKRKELSSQIMACVEFKNIDPEELVKLSRTHNYLLDDACVKEAILEANWYHTCQQRQSEDPCRM